MHTDAPTVVFHDCDLVPDDDMLALYMAPWPAPVVHFGCRFTRYNNTHTYFGGVTGWQRQAFPGLSNRYWGWGGEDDALVARLRHLYPPVTYTVPDAGRLIDLEMAQPVTLEDKLDARVKEQQKRERLRPRFDAARADQQIVERELVDRLLRLRLHHARHSTVMVLHRLFWARRRHGS